jgi:tetratricopeptide (TPR) repeat protein
MKIKNIGIVIILLLFTAAGCSSVYKSVIDKRDQNYKEGVELYNKKNYEEARNCFKTVMDIEPGYKDTKKYWSIIDSIIKNKENQALQKANVNYNKGQTFMKHRQYEDALNCFLQVKKDNPVHEFVDQKIEECRKKLVVKQKETVKQAEILYNKKQYIEAYTACQKAINFDPSNSEAVQLKTKIENVLDEKCRKYKANGKELLLKKQYTRAQQQFELALKNNPWDNESKELLVKVKNQINLDKFYNSAVDEYNKADYFEARASFLSINNTEPGYRATEQYLEKINSILNGQLNTIYNKGVSLYGKGEFKSAIDEFNKVLTINPDHSMAGEYRQRAQSKLDIQKSLKGKAEN